VTEVHKMRYRIPANLTCKHCTLQWYWSTGNTCVSDDGYFSYAKLLESAGFRASWCRYCQVDATCAQSCCGMHGSGKFAEEFWNCADVAVYQPGQAPTPAPSTDGGSPVPSPGSAPLPTPSGSPAPTPGPCSSLWGQCGGESFSGYTCCEPGSTCIQSNRWYSQCRPNVENPRPTPAPQPGPQPLPTPSTNSWDGDNMKMTHYWDCNGQGCDASTLQPWDQNRYISSPGYGPQDPMDFGGPLYGEKMWLTGAASDALSQLMGADDGCCGQDPNDGGVGGCGKCVLVQNPLSLHPEWTAVVMKKNRCPPWSHGCDAGKPHLDVAAPGFDNLQYSTANVCGSRSGTGFDSKHQSAALGSWYTQCGDTEKCVHLCNQLPLAFQKGCKLFASWGWKQGDPHTVKYRAVPCPPRFKSHVGSQFGPNGPVSLSHVTTPGATTTSGVATESVTMPRATTPSKVGVISSAIPLAVAKVLAGAVVVTITAGTP